MRARRRTVAPTRSCGLAPFDGLDVAAGRGRGRAGLRLGRRRSARAHRARRTRRRRSPPRRRACCEVARARWSARVRDRAAGVAARRSTVGSPVRAAARGRRRARRATRPSAFGPAGRTAALGRRRRRAHRRRRAPRRRRRRRGRRVALHRSPAPTSWSPTARYAGRRASAPGSRSWPSPTSTRSPSPSPRGGAGRSASCRSTTADRPPPTPLLDLLDSAGRPRRADPVRTALARATPTPARSLLFCNTGRRGLRSPRGEAGDTEGVSQWRSHSPRRAS